MIELKNVSVHAGPFALSKISFSVPAGCHAVLMGKTGIGKTTLLECVCGLRPVETGDIFINGRNITHLPPAQREIGYVPQDLALFPTMTVREHLEFALRLRRMPTSSRQQRVETVSRLLHIDHLLSRGIQGLSGGEAQRVAMGRALSFHPPVLLLDEPLSALDDETRLRIQDMLKEVQQSIGVTILHVTHSRADADRLADCRYVLADGQVRLMETD